LPLGQLSRSVEKLLDVAAAECRQIDHWYIGTEHLLLAFAHRPEARATGLLRSIGLSPDAVRQEVLSILGHAE
jgi:ATP-dependent Clp protease ATP-binding subunit ClpC